MIRTFTFIMFLIMSFSIRSSYAYEERHSENWEENEDDANPVQFLFVQYYYYNDLQESMSIQAINKHSQAYIRLEISLEDDIMEVEYSDCAPDEEGNTNPEKTIRFYSQIDMEYDSHIGVITGKTNSKVYTRVYDKNIKDLCRLSKEILTYARENKKLGAEFGQELVGWFKVRVDLLKAAIELPSGMRMASL